MAVTYDNIAGTIILKNDGNLAPEPAKQAPRVCILGTSAKGRSVPYIMPTTSLVKAEFGSDGTLYRGMWEAKAAKAAEIMLLRIGGRPCKVVGVGADDDVGGYIVETVLKDADASDSYAIYYWDHDGSAVAKDILKVYRVSDDLLVYSNDPDAPIDRFEVTVSGHRKAGGGVNIGCGDDGVLTAAVLLSALGSHGCTVTEGKDGLELSKMEMFEELYRAYRLLQDYTFDVVIPMNVFLDDLNIVDQGNGSVTPVVPEGVRMPTAGKYLLGEDVDALGKVFVEEYQGEFYFTWLINPDPGSVLVEGDTIAPETLVNDDHDSLHKIDGTALTEDDFHEVNFAYQLARFLYGYSTNVVDATGVIGVLPPASNSLADRSLWIGKAPSWTINTETGEYTIDSGLDNGSGLLGNKFMVGHSTHRDGVFGGGFIAGVDSEFFGEGVEEELDSNEIPIDIGKYISVVADWPILRNNSNTQPYIGSLAPTYGGLYSNMPAKAGVTNKLVPNTQIIYKIGLSAIDSLAGAGYVVLRQKPQGIVVADAPMATMPNSDWRRLSTVRIVKTIVDGLRSVVEPYLGNPMNDGQKQACKNDIDTVLLQSKKDGLLKDYRPFELIQTPSMAVQGKMTCALTLIPAFEMRQITFTISLAKSL